jgi:CRISPR-associated protein Cmr6
MAAELVPNYMRGEVFANASPGLRFGMYFPVIGKDNKVDVLAGVCTLNENDKKTCKAQLERQGQLFAAIPKQQGLRLAAESVAPFATGLGNEHPLENGFAFLNPYGLPYLPGSGVKGVLRQAARELAEGEWGDSNWSQEDMDILFGHEAKDGENHSRGVLSFWDVIPQINADKLMVEIMTPHHSHYYQDGTSPHDSGITNPIPFLTVPPKSSFAFHVVCDLERLSHELNQDDLWKTLLQEAFEHAFKWLGFGAKTAVGYGAMLTKEMLDAQHKKAQEQAEIERKKRIEADAQRQQETAVSWEGAKIKFNRGNKSLTVEKDGQTAIAIQPKGEELLKSLPQAIQQKINTNQFVRVTAFVAEGVLVRVQS